MSGRASTTSTFTLPWALTVLGAQTVRDLVASPTPETLASARASMDAVTDAAAGQLEGTLQRAWTMANDAQRAIADALTGQGGGFDAGSIMRTVDGMQGSAVMQAAIDYAMPPVGWVLAQTAARADVTAVSDEFANKLQVISLVAQAHAQLGLDDATDLSLAALVDRAAALKSFPRLWAVEGIGKYIGDRALAQSETPVAGLLTDASAADLPAWTLTMLHAGIGMSFAKHVLAPLTVSSDAAAVDAAVREFEALCQHSSRPGYAGAARESLGLATRTLYPALVSLLDGRIGAIAPELHGYYWHGVGRAMYFEPMNMLPVVNAPWRAIRRLDVEAPHQLARQNIVAGLAWAISVVNMRQPAVMEAFLRHHGDLAAAEPGFRNGVTSALMMRVDTTPEYARVAPFVHHKPVDDPALASRWAELITRPAEHALRHTHPALVAAGRLEELFHYRTED